MGSRVILFVQKLPRPKEIYLYIYICIYIYNPPPTFPDSFQPPANALVPAADNVDRGDRGAWIVPVLLVEGFQGCGAEVVGAAEEDV